MIGKITSERDIGRGLYRDKRVLQDIQLLAETVTAKTIQAITSPARTTELPETITFRPNPIV